MARSQFVGSHDPARANAVGFGGPWAAAVLYGT